MQAKLLGLNTVPLPSLHYPIEKATTLWNDVHRIDTF